ncbi:uncharacterized protein LOC115444977 [Manduca sexta]|uniref:uncharacterized protein LOC115444977 n=1 Tax=Manduca sexta TaxID=7130 RepID=UPI00188FEEFB|nr:uncharacterized protein LOC115444977 [Manduca sexta]
MWYLVVIFVGNILTLICEIESRPLRDMDDITILNIFDEKLQGNKHHHSQKLQASLESKLSGDTVDNEDKSHYGSLKSREIVELIEQATFNKDVSDVSFDSKVIEKKPKHILYKLHGIKNVDDHKKKLESRANVPLDERTIRKILSYFESQVNPKKKVKKHTAKKRRQVSNLVKSAIKDAKYGRHKSIDDYSKIYVILNPLAIQESSNKDSLSDIISKLSSLSSASFPKERAEVRKDRRYKGFPVKEGMFSRRARRDSKEKYDPRDSMEDYKQKRARNDHGGGRTAIPYIRHRGDIYERDN